MGQKKKLYCKKYAYNSLYGFSNWYPILEQHFPSHHLIPSRIIYYNPEEHWKLISLLERIETLFMAEAIVHDSYEAVRLKETLRLQFKDLLEKGDKAIEEYGGKAFLKWNMVYPKDVCAMGGLGERLPGRMDNVCLYSSTFAFLIDTLSSMRIRTIVTEKKEEQAIYPLIVRKPVDLDHEIRIFIEDLHPVMATQYYLREKLDLNGLGVKPTDYFREAIVFAMNVASRLPFKNLTVDVGVDKETGYMVLVEVNPPFTSCSTDVIAPYTMNAQAIRSAQEKSYTTIFFNDGDRIVRRRIKWINNL